jgi:3-oxoacyl-[acyl-carrier protein] reductase
MIGRTAVITGAAKGIGKAIALSLAAKGTEVIIVDLDEEAAVKTVRCITDKGFRADLYIADISKISDISMMTEYVIDKYKGIDILVNNAGILSKMPIEELTEEEWQRIMDVNLKSAVFLVKHCLDHMISQKWGRIINIASMAGRMGGYETGCAYSASKAALIGFTYCIARKTAENNVTVNAIAPGPTSSDLIAGFSHEQRVKLVAGIPVGRMGKPEEIGELAAFLASEEAGFITGAVIDINGGMFMG